MTNKCNLEKRLEDLRGSGGDTDGGDEPAPKWADLPDLTAEEKERLDERFDVVPPTAVEPETGVGNDGE